MCLIKTDKDFYQYLLKKQFLWMVNIAQCLGFLPYPFTFQLQNGARQCFFKKMLKILNRTVGLLLISTVLICIVSLYIYYPHYMFEEDYPPVLNIAYHLENWLKVLTVLVTVLYPQFSEAYYRKTVESLVQIMMHYDHAWRIENVLVSAATVSKRLLVVFLIDDLTIATGLYFIVEHTPWILINLCYIPPFIAIVNSVLHYYVLFATISGIISCLNDTLCGISVDEKNGQRSYGELETRRSHVNMMAIDKLLNLHKALILLTWKTNAHYGMVLLIIMLYSFIQIGVILAELYLESSDLPLVFIWICTAHATIYFMIFLIIACANYAVQKENERTLLLLHDFNCVWNRELNAAIEYYITQISNLQDVHQACGMINLDMHLIPNVLAAITSILFILMQFADARLLYANLSQEQTTTEDILE
uniref:Gustatory receptor n=1 Tax=Anopheles epiroticus TaxID=199890 RepID=A0A182PZ76_9DIPT